MKKRLFISLTAIFLLLCMTFSLFGCDQPTNDSCEHVIGSEMGNDEKHHWFKCSKCGQAMNSEAHYTSGNYSVYNEEYHNAICDACGQQFLDAHKYDEANGCVACGFSITETKPNKEKIQIFVPQQNGIVEFTKAQIERFLAENPEYGYSISDFLIGCGPSEAATNIIIEVATAPDIYYFTQDYIHRLVQADALAPLGQTAIDDITANNDAVSVEAVTVDDKLYAYPMTLDNGYYLFYDKSIVTDPSSLEQILADCEMSGAKLHFDLESSWYAASFFFGANCHSTWESDTEGRFIGVDDNFDSEVFGLIAMKGIRKVTTSSCHVNSDRIEGDNLGAVVSGGWNAENAAKYFGKNLGVCKLPSFTVDGETYQLGSFSRYSFMGVKPQLDPEREELCSALAQYLTGEECQLERFNKYHLCPSNNSAQVNEMIKNNPYLLALKAQSSYSVIEGYAPQHWRSCVEDLAKKAATCATDDEIIIALQAYRSEIESILD